MAGTITACCGACTHAAEVAREGGAAPNPNPHLRFDLDPDGVPLGAVIELRPTGRPAEIVPVTKARVVLGRTPPADLVVPIDALSRRQCSFGFSTGQAVIEDLQSACGTYVRGEQIHGPVALRPGDTVHVANLILEVHRGP